MNLPQLVYPSSVDGRLGSLQFGAMTDDVVSVCMQVLCGHTLSLSLGKYL